MGSHGERSVPCWGHSQGQALGGEHTEPAQSRLHLGSWQSLRVHPSGLCTPLPGNLGGDELRAPSELFALCRHLLPERRGLCLAPEHAVVCHAHSFPKNKEPAFLPVSLLFKKPCFGLSHSTLKRRINMKKKSNFCLTS